MATIIGAGARNYCCRETWSLQTIVTGLIDTMVSVNGNYDEIESAIMCGGEKGYKSKAALVTVSRSMSLSIWVELGLGLIRANVFLLFGTDKPRQAHSR